MSMIDRPISVQQYEIIPIVFTRHVCIKVENHRVFSKSLWLITTDGPIRRKQTDKKAVFSPCCFGASKQAIGVTRMLL